MLEDEAIIELYWNRSEEAITETDKKYGKKCIQIARNIIYLIPVLSLYLRNDKLRKLYYKYKQHC